MIYYKIKVIRKFKNFTVGFVASAQGVPAIILLAGGQLFKNYR
jgi:hypothetical protein